MTSPMKLKDIFENKLTTIVTGLTLVITGFIALLLAEFMTELLAWKIIKGTTDKLIFFNLLNAISGMVVSYCILYVISKIIPRIKVTWWLIIFGAIIYCAFDIFKLASSLKHM